MRQPDDLADVRASYDRVADAYVQTGAGLLGPEPWLRAALAAFAEHVAPLGPVLDVGCGPGTTTAHLAGLGVDVRGVDLSPRMVQHARRLHPGPSFDVASATELQLADASLGGALAWWSLFNLPRDVLAEVVADLARALVPGGQLLLGTHVGDEDVPRTSAYGVDGVRWTTHRWLPEALVAVVVGAGLEPVTELRFPARGTQPPQVLLCAQRPGVTGRV
ncbi:class I SAM-dependent methyltransferase [Streptomyces sp. NP160]|uniref:class I SAM-dependent DNA methyltransferase n=1 Tax=Streptomyces sp. NP160 TaxID=2586637 RepID=UPI001118BC18|nr:class I SAM-dependent methyltransferase [Streptomyces sp. NP160]TNM64148.1 class I SAM-dependent methyltransferase [Streptomyces sp. NP160]